MREEIPSLNNQLTSLEHSTPEGIFQITPLSSGWFHVESPALLGENGQFHGWAQLEFPTLEEAREALDRAALDVAAARQIAAEEAKFFDKWEEYREYRQLEPTFLSTLRIQKYPGEFRVVYPGEVENGRPVFERFTSWEEAKRRFFEKNVEIRESLNTRELLNIRLDDTSSIAFSAFDGFDPNVAPTDQVYEIPESLQRVMYRDEKGIGIPQREQYEMNLNATGTFRETTKDKEWKRSLFRFIRGYMAHSNPELGEQLGITDIRRLTPRQAIELSNEIVLSLTKYNRSYMGKNGDENVNHASPADKSHVLDILAEGLENKDNPDWQGNGVCRNFATSVFCCFEALKEWQHEVSSLHNTYCLYETGSHYAPGMEDETVSHAWNTFFTVMHDGSAGMVSTDVTWAKQDLETRRMQDFDYILTRMEPYARFIGREFDGGAGEDGMKKVLEYYMTRIQTCTAEETAAYASVPAQQRYYANGALDLALEKGCMQDLPDGIMPHILQCILERKHWSKGEVEQINLFAQKNPTVDLHAVMATYAEPKTWNTTSVNSLLFADEGLQLMFHSCLKKRPEALGEIMEKCPKYRDRIMALGG
ncbi:MAG: hypothetical protein ACAH35_05660 [Candidatus Paceibacterota bacterium]